MKKKPGNVKGGLRKALTEGPVRWWDWAVLLALSVFCFLCFEMRDLYHTAGCSYGFLDGHFLDFYDYLAEYGIGEDGTAGLHASYLPTIYLLFAVWNIPMRLFGFVPSATAALSFVPIMWAKLFPCLCFFASGYFVYRIGRISGMGGRKCRLLLYAYLGAPVAMFSQFIMGQYEAVTALFSVMGVYFYLKRKTPGFLICFSVAVSLKYTALIWFLPLLLLREKNILKIVGCSLASLALTAVFFLLFRSSETFSAYVFGVGQEGDAVTGYITNASYFTGYTLGGAKVYVVYLSYLAFAFVCALAYFTVPGDSHQETLWGFWLLNLASASLFCLAKWHPQWLLAALPFWVISWFLHRDTKIFLAVDLLFGALYVMFTVCQFDSVCDEVMLNNGILKYLLPGRRLSAVSDLKEYLGFLDMSLELTFLTAIMAVYAFFTRPGYAAKDPDLSADRGLWWMRARLLLPALLFILPSLLVVKNNLSGFTPVYSEERRGTSVVLSDNVPVTQEFTASQGTLKKLVFPVSRGENGSTEGTLLISVAEEDGTVLYETRRSVAGMGEGELIYVSPGFSLGQGGSLFVSFTLQDASEDSTFSLLGMEDEAIPCAEQGGEALACHLDMVIYQ